MLQQSTNSIRGLESQKQAIGKRPGLLAELPTEVTQNITCYLTKPSDIACLVLACKRLSEVLLDELYIKDAQNWNCAALMSACQSGNVDMARRSIEAGASVDHDFFEKESFALWPVSRRRRVVRTPTAGRPLSLAVQARQLGVVRLLLSLGADPNKRDFRAAYDHNNAWYPIHWALSCGNWRGGCFFRRGKYETSPIDSEIVAELLSHRALPNLPTEDCPVKGPVSATKSHRSNEASYPLHQAVCAHVPVEVVRLLLDAGADPHQTTKEFGCGGAIVTGLWTSFRFLAGSVRSEIDDENDRKVILLAQYYLQHYGGRGRTWSADPQHMCNMMERLSPTRIELLRLFLEDHEYPLVLIPFVYKALDMWQREKEILSNMVPAEADQEGLSLQEVVVHGYKSLIHQALALLQRKHIDSNVPDTNLVRYFSKSYEDCEYKDFDDILKLLATHNFPYVNTSQSTE